ncbi:hypothetical protein MMC25_003596 [Agyrium rufum]|nr:hypothetical protein [Agyrium rufum]
MASNPSSYALTNGTSQVSQPSKSQAIASTALLINESTPTIVGHWDLQKPLETESPKRIKSYGVLKSLGSEGDRRTRLFLSHVHGDGEIIGTSWLIGNDIIATAGHNLYERKFNGGCLRYIKCYFVYDGPTSVGQYRWGTSIALPAEYLKADSDVHDVGFVRLNEPAQGILPLQYSNTPQIASAELGVVGYPSDIDFGRYLYEHWASVDINLAKMGNLLSYRIDTGAGDSGAPVLRSTRDGQMKQLVFTSPEDFLMLGCKTQTVSNIPISSSSLPAPGFEMRSVFVLSAESRKRGHKAGPSLAGFSSPETIRAQDTLDALFGKPAKPDRQHSVAKGKFLHFPESLRLDHRAMGEELPAVDLDKAVSNAKAQNDIQTIFFVDFPSDLQGQALKGQQDLMASV